MVDGSSEAGTSAAPAQANHLRQATLTTSPLSSAELSPFVELSIRGSKGLCASEDDGIEQAMAKMTLAAPEAACTSAHQAPAPTLPAAPASVFALPLAPATAPHHPHAAEQPIHDAAAAPAPAPAAQQAAGPAPGAPAQPLDEPALRACAALNDPQQTPQPAAQQQAPLPPAAPEAHPPPPDCAVPPAPLPPAAPEAYPQPPDFAWQPGPAPGWMEGGAPRPQWPFDFETPPATSLAPAANSALGAGGLGEVFHYRVGDGRICSARFSDVVV